MLGYGAVAYVKTVYRDNSTQCCFVFGKSRVAPLKPVSVPRLELTAAVLTAKISQFVIRECDFKFSRVFLWTDSTVVLRYINNTSARFKTFVANRLEIIHSLTNVNDWHFVPTASNPADLASRGVWPDKCQSADIWFHGPVFLRNIAVDCQGSQISCRNSPETTLKSRRLKFA